MLIDVDCLSPQDVMLEAFDPHAPYEYGPTSYGHELLEFIFEHFEVTPKSDYAKEHWGGMR